MTHYQLSAIRIKHEILCLHLQMLVCMHHHCLYCIILRSELEQPIMVS